MATLTVTQNFGKGASDLGVYRSLGGYASLGSRLFDLSQFELIDLVSRSGLRGRGGAGFPTGMKWSFVPRNSGKPVYLVVNADEGEPGTFKDHVLMLEDPHRLIEGMLICGWALGVRTAYIYVRGEFLPAIEALNRALKQAYDAGILGENIQGTGYSLDIYVHRGAGAYICGEETALINSLEGYKGQPRLKPPFPAVSGAWASPTCVNNVETLMALPWILENGPAAYQALGTPKSGGTKVFSVSGDVKRPGVYEVPMGTPLMELLESKDLCQGILGELKGVIPGGSSSPVLTAEEARKANLDYEALAALKTMLGSGAVIAFNTTRNAVGMLASLTRFYAHESCGQCTPCREGTGYADRILKSVVAGKGRDGDLEQMLDLAANFSYTTICPLAIADAWPIENFIGKFRPEFEKAVSANPGHAAPRVDDDFRPGAFW
ncbi:MAG: NADH-quinone oxidoreductase subunit NuoF [Fibrobacterota bacterium]|nr:NADH-quinone oxidoreductase subunit NuoF [Fibrobacterota bacterium]QQS05168.1 MAG: NADH-quinone oxidoreductase subunit NuoF [Fibrobacterota bacterium]